MQGAITDFINSMIMYDYILFASLFIVFIIFVIIGIVIRKKTIIAVSLIVFAFFELFAGSTLGYSKMHEYLYKNEVEITNNKKLNFTQAVVVEGVLKNLSQRDFKSCDINVKVHKKSKYKIKEYILRLKPIAKMSIIEQDIKIGQERPFKMIIEPFTYKYDYNISAEAKCR